MSRSRVFALENLQQFAAINILSDPGAIAGPKVVPSVAEIVLYWTLASGKIGHNVLHGRYSGSFAGSVAQANSILAALNSGGAYSAMAAFLATTCSLSFVTLRDINSPNNPLISSSGAGGPGTSASPEMPNEVAICITERTAFTGPAFRGRTYIPGWATNALATGNIIAPAVVTAINAWANTIPGALSAQGYTFVLAQPARQAYTGSTGRQHPARIATSTPITSQSVRDNHWDSQRRRGLR